MPTIPLSIFIFVCHILDVESLQNQNSRTRIVTSRKKQDAVVPLRRERERERGVEWTSARDRDPIVLPPPSRGMLRTSGRPFPALWLARLLVFLTASALLTEDALCQQGAVTASHPLHAVVVNAGRAMVERYVHRGLYYGHHNPGTETTPWYNSTQLVGLGWDPMYVRKQGDGGGSDAVLLIRRREGEPEAAEGAKLGCHLLYFHGNNQNLMGATETLADFEREVGCEVWAAEYTGYGPMDGGPRGVPSEQALASDAMAAASWLLSHAGRDVPVFLYGHSLGAALAIEAAASIAARPTREGDARLAGLVLEAPFLTAIKTVVDYDDEDEFGAALQSLGSQFPMFNSTIAGLTSSFLEPIDKFENEDRVAALPPSLPVLVAHATNDKVIPHDHGEALFELITSDSKTSVFLESEAHALHSDEGRIGEQFFRALRDFVSENAGAEAEAVEEEAKAGNFDWEGLGRRQRPKISTARGAARGQQRSELWESLLLGGRSRARANSISSVAIPEDLRIPPVGETHGWLSQLRG